MKKRSAPGALAQLTKDHWTLKRLFEEAEDAHEPQDLARAGGAALLSLKTHAALEAEVLGPALRQAGLEPSEEEAEKRALALIAELEALGPGAAAYKGKLLFLAEDALAHMRREEEVVFPAARKARLDTPALARALAARREAFPPAPPPEA